jgi:hypothetical protein
MDKIPDLLQSFPGAAAFIAVGALVGIGWALWEKEDAVEAWGEAWVRGGVGAGLGLIAWFILGQIS